MNRLTHVAMLAAIVVAGASATGRTQASPRTISGNWKVLMEMPNAPQPYPICTFTQGADGLGGTCSVPGFPLPLVAPSIEGDVVSWTWTIGPDAYMFRGTLDPAGSTIKGTIALRLRAGEQSATFTAQPTDESQELKAALVDRAGTRTIVGDIPGGAFAVRASPDGRRAAFSMAGGIWVMDISPTPGQPRQLQTLPGANFALFDGTGERVFYIAAPAGRQALFATLVNGADSPRETLRDPARAPDSYSAAIKGLSFITLDGDDYDIWLYSEADRTTTPLVVIPGSRQLSSELSPDGEWVAYKSDETGAFEIWVQPVPSGPRTRVTTTGGRNPRWSDDGRELFFDNDRQLFSVSISGGATPTFGQPQPLPITGFMQAGSLRRLWDVMPDGRFLVLVR
jgi:hypothetical protein